jgi:NDP-hexose-3-ketoreductase
VTQVLILGLSSIVTRRVLPALRQLAEVEAIDVATTKAADPAVRGSWTGGTAYSDYAAALQGSSAELVYVSLVNSEHERWARAALEAGRHVVVDKPAFLGCDRTMRMAELAAKHGRCLCEATVFAYHPQVDAARQVFAENGDQVFRVVAVLSFPPMDASNFRYDPALGGGAMWDLGPYLAACGRVFFGVEPDLVESRVVARRGDLEIAFSALGVFGEGRSLAGQFGFDTAYVNRLQLIGGAVTVELDRAFTTPAGHANTLRVVARDAARTVGVPAADSFALFFQHVIRSIRAHHWGSLSADMLTDARVLERYREAAGVA